MYGQEDERGVRAAHGIVGLLSRGEAMSDQYNLTHHKRFEEMNRMRLTCGLLPKTFEEYKASQSTWKAGGPIQQKKVKR